MKDECEQQQVTINMQVKITICPPSRRNKPKQTIYCPSVAVDVHLGRMVKRKEAVEQTALKNLTELEGPEDERRTNQHD